MRRFLVLAVLAGAACGDNSKECGEGTHDADDDGVCVPDEPAGDVVCGFGTQLDPVTMDRCVPDPSACGPGLVLVNGVCSDPTAALAVDVEEGPEPNGFELDATPAGTLAIAAGGAAKVLHGCITPAGGAADFDVYRVTVAAPTLLAITADGVQDLVGGFRITSTEPTAPLATWRRLGLTFGGDVSHREVYLPAAGTYLLALADARTLFPLVETPGANLATLPAAGNADGTSCYFVTITPIDRAPVALDPATGDTSTIARALKLFTLDGLPAGTYRFTETIGSPLAQPALLIYVDDVLRVSDADGFAQTTVQAGQRVFVVGDFLFDYGAGAAAYRLTVGP